MPILVTGATGFVGGHVARLLESRGAAVRVLVRPTSRLDNLEGLRAERVTGDLKDIASLYRALRGCEMLFHVAADYRLWTPDSWDLYYNNLMGTSNLFEAAAEVGVKRIVYTSTVGTLRPPAPGELSDEDSCGDLREMAGHYKRSKFLTEVLVMARARRGLPVVVVNPTAPVGEADVKPTPTGAIILDFLRGRMPAYINTGLNLVDVRAVAEGHLAAAERGRIGERYLLGDRNMTLRQILETLARLTGRKPPRLRIPYAVAYAFAALETAMANRTGRPPRAPLEAVRMAKHKMFVRCDKAARELAFRPGPVEAALERAIAWFREHGYVRT